jgi:hypothetical protein
MTMEERAREFLLGLDEALDGWPYELAAALHRDATTLVEVCAQGRTALVHALTESLNHLIDQAEDQGLLDEEQGDEWQLALSQIEDRATRAQATAAWERRLDRARQLVEA